MDYYLVNEKTSILGKKEKIMTKKKYKLFP